jgi:hypothetical protein
VTDLDAITLEYSGLCACGSSIPAGEPVAYDRARRTIVCASCLSTRHQTSAADLASASMSLQSPSFGGRFGAHAVAIMDLAAARPDTTTEPGPGAEGYRHRHAGEDNDKGPRSLLGRTEPSDRALTKAAKQGADSERAITVALRAVVDVGDALLLTNRRIPDSRAHIDHLVIAGDGVFVVDAQRYAGAAVAVRQAGGMFGPRQTDLYVRGRQRNDLVGGVEKLAASVRTVLEGTGLAEVPVTPVLCLVGGSFPMFHGILPAGETAVVGLKPLRKLLGHPGPLDAAARERVYVSLAASLTTMA